MSNLIIIRDGVNLRVDPTTASAVLLTTTARSNYAVVIGTREPSDGNPNPWLRIRTDEGQEPYVRADKVKALIGDFTLLGAGSTDALVPASVLFPPAASGTTATPTTPPSGPASASGKWPSPLSGYTVTEGYHGDTGGHAGYDLAAPLGTPIYARGTGLVFSSEDCPGCPGGTGAVLGTNDPLTRFGFGQNIVIRYPYAGLSKSGQAAMDKAGLTNGYLYVRTAHLSKRNVGAGASVTDGMKIGEVGTSGNSTGSHCHLETRGSMNAQSVNVYGEKLLNAGLFFAI